VSASAKPKRISIRPQAAFENPNVVRSSIDKRHVHSDARIAGASEIAFFPPMTGG
jgi:molybdopterin synthase sulfur carrier subunit